MRGGRAGVIDARGNLVFEDCIEVLIGGYCGGERALLSIDARGTVGQIPPATGAPLLAVGTSKSTMDISDEVLMRDDPAREWNLEFGNLVHMTLSHVITQQPCRILKVTPTAVEHMSVFDWRTKVKDDPDE
jgi:hypothetical protein